MDSTKVSKLLLAWLVTQGHEVIEYVEGTGITTRYGTAEYAFGIGDGYGDISVHYDLGKFSFYKGGALIKETNLNEFS